MKGINLSRFPGQYYDPETGLHYNYFRCYNPQTGRYITPDPIGLEGGINLFLYTEGNPVNQVDPFGLFVDHYELSSKAFSIEKCKMALGATEVANKLDYMGKEAQEPRNAHWHAMRNGDDPDETVDTAREKTENYITDNLRKCNPKGLGRALHAEQDKHAGGHIGYQPWGKGVSGYEHYKRDRDGGGQSDAIAASVRLIKRFKEMCPCACGQ